MIGGSLCILPVRISGPWAESPSGPSPCCGLVPPSGHCLFWFKFPWANLVFFRELQDSSSNYNFKLIIFHFVCLVGMISLWKIRECRNPFSFSLLLGMVLLDMALPAPFTSYLLLFPYSYQKGNPMLYFLYLCIYLIMDVLHRYPSV